MKKPRNSYNNALDWYRNMASENPERDLKVESLTPKDISIIKYSPKILAKTCMHLMDKKEMLPSSLVNLLPPHNSPKYSSMVLRHCQGRVPEDLIGKLMSIAAQNPGHALKCAVAFKERFPEAEVKIMKSPNCKVKYLDLLQKIRNK